MNTVRRADEVIRNYLACVALLTAWLFALLGLAVWQWTPASIGGILHVRFAFGRWAFFGVDVLVGVYVLYLVGLIPYYFSLPAGYTTKCRRVWKLLRDRRRPNGPDTTALLSMAVKGIYIPLMSVWMVQHLQGFVYIVGRSDTFWSLLTVPWVLHLLFFLDVAVFLFGYCVEHPRLGNEIRSVEPTVIGWLVALMCYPPLRQLTIRILGENPDVMPFEMPLLNAAVAALTVLLFGIYVWATLALNVRASNLTNRGIVSSGPYRWVRHPAYAAKNFAWWVAAISIVATSSSFDPASISWLALATVGWTVLYYARAVTEERHLGRDPAYREYCSRTRYRFVPGLL